MTNYLVIFFCLAIGYLFRTVRLVKADDYKIINTWVIYIGLPAIALRYIPQIDWKIDYVFTAALPVLVFGLSWIFFAAVQCFVGFSKRTLATLTIVSGLNNTSFVGFPLIISFFGEEYLKVGIVSDQVTFFILSSWGVILASGSKAYFDTRAEKIRFMAKRILTFPPLIACLVALLLPDRLSADFAQDFFAKLASTVTPLALFSIGMQLQLKNLDKEFKAISLSLFFKLLLSPSFVLAAGYFLGVQGVFFQVSVFEMAMPCLVASSMVIQQFGLNTKLANTVIGISILLGLMLAYVWFLLIIHFL